MSGARAAGNLWCCGSRRLNFIISSPIYGMRNYELSEPFVGVIAPRFVSELQGLKEILIRSKETRLPKLSTSFASQRFHATIEKIEIQSPDCLAMWMKQQKFLIFRTNPTCLNFGNSFPRLSTLSLDFSGRLDREEEADHLEILIQALPTTLTSLSLVGNGLGGLKYPTRPVTFPANLTDLTLDIFPLLDFDPIFVLFQLRKLSLPNVKSSFYSVNKCKPMPSLTHLHAPHHASVTAGAALIDAFPNLTYLSGFERHVTAQFLEGRPKLCHLTCDLNRGIPTILPQNLTNLTLYGVVNLPKQMEKPIAESQFLTTLHLELFRCPPRDFLLNLPSTITTLSCSSKGSSSDFYKSLPSTLLHLQFLGTNLNIPTKSLPKTLLSVIYPQDVALNVKNTKQDPASLDWISMDSAICHDDLNAVVELRRHFKSFSPALMAKSVLNALSLPRPRILEFLSSMDTFWTVWRDNLSALSSFSQDAIVLKIFREKGLPKVTI